MTSRSRILDIARAEIGRTDPTPIWRDVLGGPGPYPPHWCGAFALWCLRRAGLTDWTWQVGRGFLWRLQPTSRPQLGDIGYVARAQHHAVIVDADLTSVRSIDGNAGTPPSVIERVRPRSDYAAFYSIETLATAPATLRVLDVSHYNTAIDWHAAARAGYAAAYVRISTGRDIDPAAHLHVECAQYAGLLVGGYHHYTPDVPAAEQIATYTGAAPELDLAPCVDVESYRDHRASPAWVPGVAEVLAGLAARYGEAIRYHNVRDWDLMGRPAALLRYPLWLADHTGGPDLPGWCQWQHAPEVIPGVCASKLDWSEATHLISIRGGTEIGPLAILPE